MGRTARQEYALTHPLEGRTLPSDELVTATWIDRGAHRLVVVLAVDR
jgi:hypothetical protein